jgi:hypothetical protein
MKNARFIWALYHKAIVINAWRMQIYKNGKTIYPICDFTTLETFVHSFYDCYNGKKNVVVGYNHCL